MTGHWASSKHTIVGCGGHILLSLRDFQVQMLPTTATCHIREKWAGSFVLFVPTTAVDAGQFCPGSEQHFMMGSIESTG